MLVFGFSGHILSKTAEKCGIPGHSGEFHESNETPGLIRTGARTRVVLLRTKRPQVGVLPGVPQDVVDAERAPRFLVCPGDGTPGLSHVGAQGFWPFETI